MGAMRNHFEDTELERLREEIAALQEENAALYEENTQLLRALLIRSINEVAND